MIEKKFFKNLYQTIPNIGAIMVLEIPVLAGYFCSLQYEDNFGFVLLIVTAVIACLYFVISFYWIFQKVIISKTSIKIIFLGKIIREYFWDNVDSIKRVNHLKNPSLKITFRDGSFIHLDDRKKIRRIINEVSNYCWI